DRVEELVAMPAGGQRSGLGLAVADHTGNDEVGIVEDRAVSMGKGVAKLAAFVNGAGRFGRYMAGDAAGKAELGKQTLEPVLILAGVRINFAVGPFQVSVGDQGWSAMPGAGDVQHAQVMLLDEPVQVDIDKVLAGRR